MQAKEVSMNRLPISLGRMTLVLLSIVLAFTLLACDLSSLLSQVKGVAAPSSPTGSAANPPTQPAEPTTMAAQATGVSPTVPNGWKASKDSSGTCQVATPPDWQLGRDFFLEAEKTDPGPFVNNPGQFPPMGRALWGTAAKGTPVPEGKQFQIRTSVVRGDVVCSVWRIKATTDFTDAEKSTMEQVGKTLQEVK
jgi:hypothetical protein